MRADRVEKALHFDTSRHDDVPMTQTYSTGVQAEAQTSSYGVQAEAQTSSYGVQAEAQTRSSGTQPSKTKVDEIGGTQTTMIKTKETGNQATEDRPEEIEPLRQANELEQQTLIYQYEQTI